MSYQKILVELALSEQNFTQKQLAIHLGVSGAQISKWKNGEHMSLGMQERLSELANIGDMDVTLIDLAGSVADAHQWASLMLVQGNLASNMNDSGYECTTLESNLDGLIGMTACVLKEMGVSLPQPFPESLKLQEGEDPDDYNERVDEDPYVALIFEIYRSYANVDGFYYAYIYKHINACSTLTERYQDLDVQLFALGAMKVCQEKHPIDVAPRCDDFIRSVQSKMEGVISNLRIDIMHTGRPLEAELMDLLGESHEAIGMEAERKALGLDRDRVHPDIYMNELLEHARYMKEVLPKILKKLDIH